MLPLLLSLVAFAVANAQITQDCMDCIRQTEGGAEGSCNWDVYSDSCGPFQIKIEYWCDANWIDPSTCTTANYDTPPNTQWRDCTMFLACSEDTIRGYMDRYGTWCSGLENPTCEVYSRVHNGGPSGCTCSCTDGYWDIVSGCCAGKPSCG